MLWVVPDSPQFDEFDEFDEAFAGSTETMLLKGWVRPPMTTLARPLLTCTESTVANGWTL